MKYIIILILLCNTVYSQTSTLNNFIVDSLLVGKAASCASPDGPTTEIAGPPVDYQYLEDNGYCLYNYPTTSSFTACFTMIAPGTNVDFNAGSSVSCNNRTFSGFTLYDASCTQVGTGLSYSGLTPGAQYTWCLSMRAFGGPICNGFDTFCPYYINMSPMPVNLISYEVDCNKLTWSTLSEINNDYFIIERSIDTENWEKIGKVLGNGNTVSRNDYNFTLIYTPKVSYYRIKQIDYDGSYKIFKTLVVNCKEQIEFIYYNILGQQVSESYTGYKYKIFK